MRRDPDYDIIYSNLLDKQAEINDKQNLVRELLYKSRDIVKESTNTGRVTLLIFIDINDFFERVMSLQLHHKLFHQYFDNSDILESFKNFLSLIAEELNETGIALKSGRPYEMNDRLQREFLKLKQHFEEFRLKEYFIRQRRRVYRTSCTDQCQRRFCFPDSYHSAVYIVRSERY